VIAGPGGRAFNGGFLAFIAARKGPNSGARVWAIAQVTGYSARSRSGRPHFREALARGWRGPWRQLRCRRLGVRRVLPRELAIQFAPPTRSGSSGGPLGPEDRDPPGGPENESLGSTAPVARVGTAADEMAGSPAPAGGRKWIASPRERIRAEPRPAPRFRGSELTSPVPGPR
jgi:hypothetical protein